MTRLHTSFVLGYHGCSVEVGKRVVNGEPMDASDHAYDWLGPGIYFWESDPARAWEWADRKVSRGDFEVPCVVGAAIDFGNCLDLMVRENLLKLEEAYLSFSALIQSSGGKLKMPTNQRSRDMDEDYLLRFLDCAVVKHLHLAYEKEKKKIDTVRGLFIEGDRLYPGSNFRKKTHIQIAVRSRDCIKGLFQVPRP